MNKVRFQAALMAGIMMMSMLLGSCGSSKKKKESKGAAKNAEAMLDDFCAYLRSGKYEKIDKLVDGTSKELDKLKDYKNSEIKNLLEAARKRISFSIEDVKADEDKEEGEATIVFTYFDVEDVAKKVDDDSSLRDVEEAIKKAEELELEYEVGLSYGKDWMIEASSADQIMEDMFSFLGDLHFETKPTETTVKKQSLSEFSYAWYDDQFNEVQGYHESTTFIRLIVTFWEECYDETITYTFYDGGTVLFSGTAEATGGVDYVYCDWEPTSKLPVDWIACDVYDSNNNLVTVACVRVYGDNEVIPQPVYVFGCDLVDSNGNIVPGYHESDTYIAARVSLDKCQQDAYINYEYHRYNFGKDEVLHQGSVPMESEELILQYYGDVKTPGDYYIIVYDMEYNELWETQFQILADGADFEVDATKVEIWNGFWVDVTDKMSVSKIPQGADAIIFQFQTNEYFNYTRLTYEVEDGTGKKIQEGSCQIVRNYSGEVSIDLSNMKKGPISITLYDSSGNLVWTDTIEED